MNKSIGVYLTDSFIYLYYKDKVIVKEVQDNAVSNNRISKPDSFYKQFNKIIKENKENEKIKNVKIVANLPYYITTPIIMKLLEEKLDIESITVMIQKEVADRLIEIPSGKNTGAITYTVYYYAESQKILEVPNNSFIPEPEVTSEVIKLNIRKEKPNLRRLKGERKQWQTFIREH